MAAQESNRPEYVRDEHLEFLDKLREKGLVMFAAGPYLEDEFGLSSTDAYLILVYWLATFGKENR